MNERREDVAYRFSSQFQRLLFRNYYILRIYVRRVPDRSKRIVQVKLLSRITVHIAYTICGLLLDAV